MSVLNTDIVVHTELDAYMNSIGFECGQEIIDDKTNFYFAGKHIGDLKSVNSHHLRVGVCFMSMELEVVIDAFGLTGVLPVINGFYFDTLDDIKKQIERNDFLQKLLKC